MTLEQPSTAARVTIASIPKDYSGIPPAELIEACVNGENAAWLEFIRRYNRIIAITVSRVARRWGEPSPQLVDDIVQETYLKLCGDRARVLREFRFDHPDAILAFLKVVAANVAHDHLKRENNLTHGGDRTFELLEEGLEPAVAPGGPPELTPAEQVKWTLACAPCRRRKPATGIIKSSGFIGGKA
jgi:DNA-directed RNA polymerase specialized sigma24 family protein